MRPLPAGVAFAVGAAIFVFGGYAAAEDAPRACLDAARGALGAAEDALVRTWFLDEGEHGALRYTFRDQRCVGFLGAGHRGVRDLDLVVFTGSGIELATDVGEDAHPFVHVCGAEGLVVAVRLEAARGRGEAGLLVAPGVPARLPDLSSQVGRCFARASGVHTPEVRIGPPPPGPTIEARTEGAEARLEADGLRPATDEMASMTSTVEARRWVGQAFEARTGHCYAALAVGGPAVPRVGVAVRGQDGDLLSRAVGQPAVARFCVDDAQPVAVDGTALSGGGELHLALYALQEEVAAPPGVEGVARFDWAAAASRSAERRLELRGVEWGWLAPGLTLRTPVQVEAGRCYVFTALRSAELATGDLDIVVVRSSGARAGWNLGSRSPPMVYHCASANETLQVATRLRSSVGRVLVAMGVR